MEKQDLLDIVADVKRRKKEAKAEYERIAKALDAELESKMDEYRKEHFKFKSGDYALRNGKGIELILGSKVLAQGNIVYIGVYGSLSETKLTPAPADNKVLIELLEETQKYAQFKEGDKVIYLGKEYTIKKVLGAHLRFGYIRVYYKLDNGWLVRENNNLYKPETIQV